MDQFTTAKCYYVITKCTILRLNSPSPVVQDRYNIITMRNLIFTDISPLTKTVNNLVNPVLCPEGLQLKIVSEQNYVGKQTIFTLEDSHSNFPNCFQNHTHK